MSDLCRSATTTSEEEEEWDIYSPSGTMGKKTKSKKSHKKNKRLRTSPSDQQQQQQQQQERSKIEPEPVQQKPDRDVEHRRRRQETNYFDPRELERYQQVNRTAQNSSKMCSFCLITGHATSDCDLRRQCKILNKLRCEFCEFYGHSIDDCPIYGREICSFCGVKGHDHERCETLKKAMRGSQNATKKFPPEAKKCTFCGNKGHNDEHCPEKEVERRSSLRNYTRTSSIHSYTESKNYIKKYGFEENSKEKTSHESKKEKCTFFGKNGHDDERCPKKEEARKRERENSFNSPNLDNWSTNNSETTFSSIYSQIKSVNNIEINELEENYEKNITLDSKVEECKFYDVEGRDDKHCSMKKEVQEKAMLNYLTPDIDQNTKYSPRNFSSSYPLSHSENNFFTKPGEIEEKNSNFYSKPVHDYECTLQLKQDKGNNSDSERNLLQCSKSYIINTIQSIFGLGSKPSDSDIENDEKPFKEVKHKKRNKIPERELCLEHGHDEANCPMTKESEKSDLYNQASKRPGNETLKCELCLKYGHKKTNCPMTKELEKSDLYNQASNQPGNETLKCELCLKYGHKKTNCPMTKEFEKPDLYNQASNQPGNETLKCELCLKYGHKKTNCPMTKESEKSDLYNQTSKRPGNETLKCKLCLKYGHKKENCPITKESEKLDLYDQRNEDYEHSSYSDYNKKKESYGVAKGLGNAAENNDSFDHINVNCELPSYSDCLKDSKKNSKSSKNINGTNDLESDLCYKYRNMNLCDANQDNDTKKKKSSTEQLQKKILTGVKEFLPMICTMHHFCYKCHPPLYYFEHYHKSCEFVNELLKLCDANVQKINCEICYRQCVFAEDPEEK